LAAKYFLGICVAAFLVYKTKQQKIKEQISNASEDILSAVL